MKQAILICLFTSFILFIPKLSLAQKQVASSSYELFYPVVAGKLPGDPFYFLKSIHEQIVGIFIFNNNRKADYFLILSKKRLVEAEALIPHNNPGAVTKEVANAADLFQKAVNLNNSIDKQGGKAKDLYNTLSREGEKELQFAKSLSQKINTTNSNSLQPLIDKLQKLLDEVRQKSSSL